MMHLVMCGRIKHILQGAKRTNGLCVDPALVEEVELGVGKHVHWGNSEEREGQVEDPGKEALQRGVPHTHGHGEVLAAVVDLVNSPQHHDLCGKDKDV